MISTWVSLRGKLSQRRSSPGRTRQITPNVSAEERLGEEGLREFLADRRAGLSHAALAKKYRLAASTVQRVLTARGLTGAVEDRTRDKALVAQLHSQGWAQRRIARHVGCSPKTVHRWMKAMATADLTD